MAPRLSSDAAALALGSLLLATCLFGLFIAPLAILWLPFGVALVLSGFVIGRRAGSRAARLAGFVLPVAGGGIALLALGWLIGWYDLRGWVNHLYANPVGFGLAALGVLGAAALIREGTQLLVDRQWRAGLLSVGIGVLGLLLLGGAVLGILLRSVGALTLLLAAGAFVAVVVTSALSILVQPSSVATAGGPELPSELPPLPTSHAPARRGSAPPSAPAPVPTGDPLVAALRHPDRVTTLDLAGRGLSVLPTEVGRLRNLRSLDLGEALGSDDTVLNNRLRTLPSTIGGLRHLETLNLSANAIEILPDEFGWLERLTTLNLRFNRLRTVPEALRSLRALETLYLERNSLETLPPWIGELRALRVLNVADNRLTTLPDSLGRLCALRSLDLSHNRIAALPETIGALAQLETLSLHANLLRALPTTMRDLQTLRALSLGANPLDLEQALPLLAHLPALETLDVSNVRSARLPTTIDGFPALRTLILRGNALESLPEWVADLPALESLDLAANRLRDLPPAVRRLRRLELDGNPLLVR